MPVCSSHLPNTLARWTSQAARYWSAPPRSYSCSTRIARAAAGGRLGWQRQRAWMEGFSSAETTKSLHPNALAPKAGSRGKIQERKVQGRMASLSSHRQIVAPEIDATMPRRITSALMSGTKSRDSGRSSLDGRSQAIALTSIAACGGKNRRSSVAGKFLEAGQPLLEEALSPQRDHLPAGIKAPGDLVVAKSLGCQQDDPGSDHISIRQRIFSSPGL